MRTKKTSFLGFDTTNRLELYKEIESLEAEVRTREEKYVSANNLVLKFKADAEQAMRDLAIANKEAAQWRKDAEEGKQRKRTAQDVIKPKNKTNSDLVQQCKDRDTRIAELEALVSKLRQKNDILQTELTACEASKPNRAANGRFVPRTSEVKRKKKLNKVTAPSESAS